MGETKQISNKIDSFLKLTKSRIKTSIFSTLGTPHL